MPDRDLEVVRFLHYLRFLSPVAGTAVGSAVRGHLSLPPENRVRLAEYARALGEHYSRIRSQRVDSQDMLEMAVVSAGSVRNPGDPLGALAAHGGMSEEHLRYAVIPLDIMLRVVQAYGATPIQRRTSLSQYATSRGIDLPVDPEGQPGKWLLAMESLGLLDKNGLLDLYREIAVEEGQQLARDTVAFWQSDPSTNSENAQEALLYLTCLVPGSLLGVHAALMRHGMLEPSELYRGADARVRDELISLAETDLEEHRDAVDALICIGDEVVATAFHRWRQTPPPAYPSYGFAYAYNGEGWVLTDTGERRFLYHPECYRLVPEDSAPAGAAPGPVGVLTPHGMNCGRCGRALVDLFDIDLQDPRLGFLAPGWERLRIVMCERCSASGNTYTEVDAHGGSRWSDFNGRPDFVVTNPDDDAEWLPAQRRLVLGPQRRSPFEAHRDILYLEDGASQLGGFPMWVIDLGWPHCPKCERAMVFIGQLQWWDVYGGGAEGVTYAFLCQDCGMATTRYEQT